MADEADRALRRWALEAALARHADDGAALALAGRLVAWVVRGPRTAAVAAGETSGAVAGIGAGIGAGIAAPGPAELAAAAAALRPGAAPERKTERKATAGPGQPAAGAAPAAAAEARRIERMAARVLPVVVAGGTDGVAPREIARALNLAPSGHRLSRALRHLVEQGRIAARGATTTRRYYPAGQAPDEAGGDPAAEIGDLGRTLLEAVGRAGDAGISRKQLCLLPGAGGYHAVVHALRVLRDGGLLACEGATTRARYRLTTRGGAALEAARARPLGGTVRVTRADGVEVTKCPTRWAAGAYETPATAHLGAV